MTNLLILLTRFMVRLTITVVWALVLSKLIRTIADLVRKRVRRNGNKVATATN